MSSSSFISKVSRLAPATAHLGVTSDQAPTSLGNPGPGTYNLNKGIQEKQDKAEVIKAMVEASKRRRQHIIDSIVEMSGAQNYKHTKKGSIPVRKLSRDGYSGVQNDRPGPQVYEPKFEVIRSKSQSALFSKSRTQRYHYGQSTIDESQPGPWTYNVNQIC